MRERMGEGHDSLLSSAANNEISTLWMTVSWWLFNKSLRKGDYIFGGLVLYVGSLLLKLPLLCQLSEFNSMKVGSGSTSS